jgi:hypothetical protein
MAALAQSTPSTWRIARMALSCATESTYVSGNTLIATFTP